MSRKAIFLDRDGTIMFDVGYPKDPKYVKLLTGVIDALTILISHNYRLIIISNQSGVGRGIISLKEMNQVNEKLISILENRKIYIDGIYYCPHTPEEQCNCRKPSPQMILSAAMDLDINVALSFMVGDRMSDIEAGKLAGCRTILLTNANLNTKEYAPDFVATDWNDILAYILKNDLANTTYDLKNSI